MPVSGRDVQCSNCGQTWFQHHPDHAPDTSESDLDTPGPDEEIAPPPPPPAPVAPVRKQLDPAVADILRQEAEAEQAARRNRTSGSLESQPDLGLDLEQSDPEQEADRRARQARERMARMRGSETADAPPSNDRTSDTAVPQSTTAAPSRRDLLPDIDEINSTLRSGSARTGPGAADVGPDIEAPTFQRQRRGFRTGFVTVLLIFAVLAVLYVIAPCLLAAVPALDGPLQAYVILVDQGRAWLDATVQGLLQSLDSVADDGTS